jgi:hypothetical protein
LLGTALIAAMLVFGSLPLASAAAKKGKSTKTVDMTQQVNQQIPNGTGNTYGLLTSTIAVGGKKLKGLVIRDANVTLQTTGSGPNAAVDLEARFTAPNGTTAGLFSTGLGGPSIGPLTIDEQSANWVGYGEQNTPTEIVTPYVGTAQPQCDVIHGGCSLSAMNGGPVTGVWSIRLDDTAAGPTSVLNLWRIHVVAGKPYKTK